MWSILLFLLLITNSFTERISEKKCLEYMDYVYEKLYITPDDPEDDAELRSIKKCAQSSTAFIVGGNETNPHEFPHMAIIGDDTLDPIEWFCGGSLISLNYVLTAAHCLINQRAGEVNIVRLGIHFVSKPSDSKVDVRVKRQIPHPEYRKRKYYADIALLELVEEIKPNPYLRPACLPSAADTAHQQLTATGWGLTMHQGDRSDVLLKVTLSLMDKTTCQERLKPYIPKGIRDTQICYGGEGGKDSCQGDSGGPLQSVNERGNCSYIIYGVTSSGADCGVEGLPSVYTNVGSYLDWIESTVWTMSR